MRLEEVSQLKIPVNCLEIANLQYFYRFLDAFYKSVSETI
jgi:hypothetical protein